MKRIIRISLILCSLMAFSPVVSAQTTDSQNSTSQTTNTQSQPPTSSESTQTQTQQTSVQTKEYSGDVLRVVKNKITIQTRNGTNEFTVPNNVQIKRNTDLVTLNKIVAGDKVSIKAKANGEVLSVTATSGTVVNNSKKILIAGIILLILVFLIWYFLRRRNRGFIKTVPTKV